MQKKHRNVRVLHRFLAVVLSAFIVFSPSFIMSVGMPSAASSASWSAEIDRIKNERNEAKNELAQISADLSAAEDDLENLERLRDLQLQEIELLKADLDSLNELLQSYSDAIAVKTEEINVLEQSLRAQFDLFCDRLVFMHENGGEGYLDFLFNSGNFFDFLSRDEIMNDIFEFDTNLINSLTINYDNLIVMKDEFVLLEKEALETIAELEAQELVLEAKYAVYEQQVADYEEALAQIQKDYQSAKDYEEQLYADLQYAQNQYEYEKLKEQQAASGNGNKNPGSWGAQYTGKFFMCPIPAGTYIKSQPFGYGHGGVDLATFNGWNADVPISAVYDGVVVASQDHYSWGQMVKISHGDIPGIGTDVYTLYAHMRSGTRTVKVGDRVTKGQVLGLVGSTGISTGPHLHFELYIGGSSTSCRCNPEAY